jgi:hypothetical protein
MHMNAAAVRATYRWLHILLSVPILGYIYGPVAEIPRAAFATRFVFVPMVILSGLWMWKGHAIKRAVRIGLKRWMPTFNK